MSFVQSHADPAARLKAVIVVGGVHALLGAALVLGLTFTKLITEEKNLPAHLYPTAPPKTPPPPPDAAKPIEKVPTTVPLPPINLYETDVDEVPITEIDPPIASPTASPTPLATPTLAPPRPAATPSFSPVSARPRNGPAGWITNDDYPRVGITRQLEGVAGYRLTIGSDGRVDECQITAGTGHTVLDRATCQLIESRARFEPATDQNGRTVAGTYSGQVTWDIPD